MTFIKRAQALGFSLDEVRGLLEIGNGRGLEVRTRADVPLLVFAPVERRVAFQPTGHGHSPSCTRTEGYAC